MTNNKPEYSKREELESIKNRRQYVQQILSAGGLEAWEAKEYNNLEIEYTKQIATLEKEVAEYEEIWKGFQG